MSTLLFYGALETTGRDFEEIMSSNRKLTSMLEQWESSFRNEPEFNQCEGRKVSRGDFRYNEYYLNVFKLLFRGGIWQGSIIKSKDNL